MSVSEEPPDRDLARRLVAQQFPEWADLPVTDVEHSGWDNRTFRLGDELTSACPRAAVYAGRWPRSSAGCRCWPRTCPCPSRCRSPRGAGLGYPHAWSVRAWLDGNPATRTGSTTGRLRRIGGGVPGGPAARRRHRRPGARRAQLPARRSARPTTSTRPGPAGHGGGRGRRRRAAAVLDAAVAALAGQPVWFHGDIAFGNLLVRDGRLAAVIDFGTSGIGDPSCDLVLAWTMLVGREPARPSATYSAWMPAPGPAAGGGRLWKALITVAGSRDTDVAAADEARRVLREILADPVH